MAGGSSRQRRIERRLRKQIKEEMVSNILHLDTSKKPVKKGRDQVGSARPQYLQYTILRLGGSLGIVALGSGLMLARLFMTGVVILYAGFAVFALDMAYEDFFRRRRLATRITLAVIYCTAIVSLSKVWIFVPAHFEVGASSKIPSYGPGSTIHGIEWRKQYSELSFYIKNHSDTNFENFDAEISTNLVIADMRLVHGVSDCRIAGVHPPLDLHWQRMVGGIPNGPTDDPRMVGGVPTGPADDPRYDYKVVPMGPDGKPLIPVSGGDWSYRILCSRIPAKSETTFVAALEVVNEPSHGSANRELFAPPKPAGWISMKARFQTSGRSRVETIVQCPMGKPCETKG